MNEIKGTFNIGGTWSETFENITEFEYCMDTERANPCVSWDTIEIDGEIYIQRVDDGGGYDYIINHDITAPEYIIDYFQNHGLMDY